MKTPGNRTLPMILQRFKSPLLVALGFHALLIGTFWSPNILVNQKKSPIFTPTNLEITFDSPSPPMKHGDKESLVPVTSPLPIPNLPQESQEAPPQDSFQGAPNSPETAPQENAGTSEESFLRELWDGSYHPLPEYPGAARKFGYEGMTVVRLKINGEGRILEVEILQSSGYTLLDKAARNKILQEWRFNPPGRDIVLVKEINFSLTQR